MRFLHFATLTAILRGVVGNVENNSDDSSDSDCLNVVQHLHGLEFDIDVASKQLSEYKTRLTNLVDTESGYEAELSDKSAYLNELRRMYVGDKELAVSTQKKLRDTELNITSLSSRINMTSLELRSVESSLRNSTAGIDALENRIGENEAESRRLELAVQMMRNDLDTANKTLIDSKRDWAGRKNQVHQLLLSMNAMRLTVFRDNATLAIAQKEHLSTVEVLQKERRFLADAQQAHGTESRKLENLKQHLSEARLRVDNEKIELVAQNRTISSFMNTTVLVSRASLAAAERDIQKISNELVVAKAESANDHGGLRGNDSSPVVLSVSPDSPIVDVTADQLRQSIRESKLLLAREGYGNRFSLLQSPDAALGVDMEMKLFKNRSKLLSLEEELRERTDEELTIKSSLNTALLKSRDLEIGYRNETDIELRDEKLFRDLSVKVQDSVFALSSISNRMAESRVRVANLSKVETVQHEKVSQAASLVSEARLKIERTNATLTNAITTLRNIETEVQTKEIRLTKMIHDYSDMNEHINRLAVGYQEALSNVSDGRHRSEMIETEIATLTTQLEDYRKSHTEALADAAQLTRRLEEKSQHMQESDALLKSTESTIKQMENRISDLLNERAEIQKKLREESGTRRDIVKRVESLKMRGVQMQCNM